jgi:hypothetical protein
MFRAPLRPASGAHDDSVGYHIGRLVLELLLVTNQYQIENQQQRYRREHLMMGIKVPETC